jgi:hypothetical protein
MKILLSSVAAISLVALVAGPASAHSDAYCANKANAIANQQAAGNTIVGAGVGCLVGQIISRNCGVGAAVGGVSGFAIGSTQWHKVYNKVYWNCKNS